VRNTSESVQKIKAKNTTFILPDANLKRWAVSDPAILFEYYTLIERKQNGELI
jgi:hypothetical protein